MGGTDLHSSFLKPLVVAGDGSGVVPPLLQQFSRLLFYLLFLSVESRIHCSKEESQTDRDALTEERTFALEVFVLLLRLLYLPQKRIDVIVFQPKRGSLLLLDYVKLLLELGRVCLRTRLFVAKVVLANLKSGL